MNAGRIETVNATLTELGEGPMWSIAEQALYWIDVVGRKVYRLRPDSGQVDVRELPYSPSAVIPRANGGLLLVTKKGMAAMDFERAQLASITVPSVDFTKEVFNDAKCDVAGRLWVGTRDIHVLQPAGRLFRLDENMHMTCEGSGYIVSNGIAWGGTGNVMYHVESKPGRIDTYDFDSSTGAVSNRRVFRDYAKAGSRAVPDGCTTDAEGGLWVAEVDDWHIRRYMPDGTLDREIRMPVQKPTSVMFGGANLSTLYVTSMRFGLSNAELLEQPLAGSLFQLDVGVKGLPEPVFQG